MIQFVKKVSIFGIVLGFSYAGIVVGHSLSRRRRISVGQGFYPFDCRFRGQGRNSNRDDMRILSCLTKSCTLLRPTM